MRLVLDCTLAIVLRKMGGAIAAIAPPIFYCLIYVDNER